MLRSDVAGRLQHRPQHPRGSFHTVSTCGFPFGGWMYRCSLSDVAATSLQWPVHIRAEGRTGRPTDGRPRSALTDTTQSGPAVPVLQDQLVQFLR